MANPTKSKPSTQKSSTQKPSTQVAKTGAGGVPANVAEALSQHAGKGVSHAIEDNIVPLVYVLQTNSKPATKGHERYIKGAEGGMIWLRNAPVDDCLIDGLEEGMIFQPCHFSKCWIEWLPERGGFVARHVDRPAAATLEDIEGDDGKIRKGWRMPSGNTVAESREFAGYVFREGHDPEPYTVPLTGSGHTIGKQWMTQMRDEKLPNGDSAPIFANLYRLKTKLVTRGPNSWYVYDITKEGAVQSVEDVQRGAALYAAFEAGTKQSAVVDEDAAPAGEGGGESGAEIDEG